MHRSAHYAPMNVASTALRSYCNRLGLISNVSQRLKRMDTILDKLTREPNMDLSTMHDLAGCRVVVLDLADLRVLQERLVANHPDARVYDYVAAPRPSGYRAVHVVASWGGGLRKPVEIQLRTSLMHRWADMVEQVSGVLGINYKRDGHANFQLWATSLSQILEMTERSVPVPVHLAEQQDRAWQAIVEELEGGSGNE